MPRAAKSSCKPETSRDRDPRYLTAAETAELLRCSVSQVYTLIRDHAIPHVSLGRRVVVPADDLDAWLEARTVRPQS